MTKAWMLLPITAMMFTGCYTVNPEPTLSFKPPRYVEELPSKELDDEMPRMGSLFGRGDHPLFTDRKAMRINDIVTVVISENTTSSTNGKKKLAQSNVTALGDGKLGFTGDEGYESKYFKKANEMANYKFDSTSNTQYQGQGSVTRDENFKTTVTVRVVKVMNNGNYFIHGKRQMLINGEKQIIQLSGVISPFDINQNNEIPSSKVSDAKIAYVTQGDVRQNTKQGAMTRTLEAMWPF
ncbi:MAG: flagellar basal body L-ring protein FlgH [Thiovulaceae bacterium]|nr:flagellar basal body L-ring protein FlgH [Sulfurimonadaceae bacterium]